MIKKIIDSIAKDKKDHVLLGMFVGYPLMILGYIIDVYFDIDFMFITGGLFAVLLVGLKEIIHDGILGKGNVELWDFIASAIPILFPLITYAL